MLVIDLGLNVIVSVDFAGGKWASRPPAKKMMTYPPLANLIFVPPPPHTYINATIYQT